MPTPPRTIHKHVDATRGAPRTIEVLYAPAAQTTGPEDLLVVRVDAPGERAVSVTMTLPDWDEMQRAVEAVLADPPTSP